MGSYIPSPSDDQIRLRLIDRFSNVTIDPKHPAYDGQQETFLEQMKRHFLIDNMFDKNNPQPLERVAHRLAHSYGPPVRPALQTARRRWYWLLNSASNILPSQTADDIRDAIAGALAPGSGINAINFFLTYDSTKKNRYELVWSDAGGIRSLTLISNQDTQLPLPNLKQQPLNPPIGPNERSINKQPIP